LQPISLTGAKHSAFSTNHLADTDKTKNAVTTTTKTTQNTVNNHLRQEAKLSLG